MYGPKLYRGISGRSLAEPESFLRSQIIFLISILPHPHPSSSSSKQISVLECCCRAGLNHPHFAVSVLVQRKGVQMPGCVFDLQFLHIKVVCDKPIHKLPLQNICEVIGCWLFHKTVCQHLTSKTVQYIYFLFFLQSGAPTQTSMLIPSLFPPF